MDEYPKYYCACACACNKNGAQKCRFIHEIGTKKRTNLFTKYEDMEKLENADIQEAKIRSPDRSEDTRRVYEWITRSGEREEILYYLFVYWKEEDAFQKDDHRAREYEKITSKRSITITSKHPLRILVLTLFLKKETHNFIEIFEASGMNEPKLIVDKLSAVYRENRYQIHFGFLISGHEKCERVAVKEVNIRKRSELDTVHRCEETIVKEIDLAMKGGGQYNMKYLARTDIQDGIVWIAMELCSMGTLDEWVIKNRNTNYCIDDNGVKICFKHILLGLDHLHSQGIIHGEMIMQNILLSLPNRDRLKIGDYDHVKQNTDDSKDRDSWSKSEDIKSTARLFFKCLKTDGTTDEKEITKTIDSDTEKRWFDKIRIGKSVKLDRKRAGPVKQEEKQQPGEEEAKVEEKEAEPAKEEEQQQEESTEAELDKEDVTLVDKILRLVYHENPPPRTEQIELSPVWIASLRELAEECGSVNKDSIMSAYLLMHMVLDEPTAVEILQHPFFWSDCQILDFISRMEGCFFKLERKEEVGIPSCQRILKSIMQSFNTATEAAWPDLNWIQQLDSKLQGSSCDETTKQKLMKCACNKLNIKFGLSDLKKFVGILGTKNLWPQLDPAKTANEFWDEWIKKYMENDKHNRYVSYEKSDIKTFVLSKECCSVLEKIQEENIERKERQDKIQEENIQKKKRQDKIQKAAKEFWERIKSEEVKSRKTMKFHHLDICNEFERYLARKTNETCNKDRKSAAAEFWREEVARKIASAKPSYVSNIREFMRFIRNTYGHYHESFDPQQPEGDSTQGMSSSEQTDNGNKILRSFDSPTDLWKCLGNVLPEMICLLHRAVWLERGNDLLDDLRQFLLEPNNTFKIIKLDSAGQN